MVAMMACLLVVLMDWNSAGDSVDSLASKMAGTKAVQSVVSTVVMMVAY